VASNFLPLLFIPQARIIAGITQANPGVVTTTVPHTYQNQAYVRLIIPQAYGMQQLANHLFNITILSSTTFSLNVDTTAYQAFVAADEIQLPQVLPVGEFATTVSSAMQNAGVI
jgi:hypothetical protein